MPLVRAVAGSGAAVGPDDGHGTRTTAAWAGLSGSGLEAGTELAPTTGDGATAAVVAAVANSKVWFPLFLFVANVILSIPAVDLVHALPAACSELRTISPKLRTESELAIS